MVYGGCTAQMLTAAGCGSPRSSNPAGMMDLAVRSLPDGSTRRCFTWFDDIQDETAFRIELTTGLGRFTYRLPPGTVEFFVPESIPVPQASFEARVYAETPRGDRLVGGMAKS